MSLNVSNLSVLAYANSFTRWHYTTTDASITGTGYCDSACDMLRVSDMIVAAVDTGNEPAVRFYIVVANSGGTVIVADMQAGNYAPNELKSTAVILKQPVNLNKAKPGDKVRFRCGGEEIIDKIEYYRNGMFGLHFGQLHCASTSLGIHNSYPKMIIDVIALEPAPEPKFDWATSRLGMAFEAPGDERVWFFCCWDPCSIPGRRVYAVFVEASGDAQVRTTDDLVRDREHDIAVPQAA